MNTIIIIDKFTYKGQLSSYIFAFLPVILVTGYILLQLEQKELQY